MFVEPCCPSIAKACKSVCHPKITQTLSDINGPQDRWIDTPCSYVVVTKINTLRGFLPGKARTASQKFVTPPPRIKTESGQMWSTMFIRVDHLCQLIPSRFSRWPFHYAKLCGEISQPPKNEVGIVLKSLLLGGHLKF